MNHQSKNGLKASKKEVWKGLENDIYFFNVYDYIMAYYAIELGGRKMIDYILIILLIFIGIASLVNSYLYQKTRKEYHEMLMKEYLKKRDE